MISAPTLTDAIARAIEAGGIDLAKLGAAWARVVPIVTIVPAFGLRALPATARAVLGLALAAAIVPAIGANDAHLGSLLEQAARGTSIAIAAAVPLWAATMMGGVVDALRASNDTAQSPAVEGRATPLGVPLAILASAIFLRTGGASRAIAAVAIDPPLSHPLVLAGHDLVAGIALAVALAGPVLAASIVIEVGAALVARSASPAQIHALLAPLRAIAVLVVLAIGLDRIADAMGRAIR